MLPPLAIASHPRHMVALALVNHIKIKVDLLLLVLQATVRIRRHRDIKATLAVRCLPVQIRAIRAMVVARAAIHQVLAMELIRLVQAVARAAIHQVLAMELIRLVQAVARAATHQVLATEAIRPG